MVIAAIGYVISELVLIRLIISLMSRFIESTLVDSLTGAPIPRITLSTYSDEKLVLQPPWNETFAVGNLPPGEYKISVVKPGAGFQSEIIEIKSGEVTEWEWIGGEGE